MAKCAQTVTKKRLLTYGEASQEFGLTVWALRSLVWERRLPVVQLGAKKHLIDRVDLDRLIERHKGFL